MIEVKTIALRSNNEAHVTSLLTTTPDFDSGAAINKWRSHDVNNRSVQILTESEQTHEREAQESVRCLLGAAASLQSYLVLGSVHSAPGASLS